MMHSCHGHSSPGTRGITASEPRPRFRYSVNKGPQAAEGYRGQENFLMREDLAYDYKRGPVIGVRVIPTDFLHRPLHCHGLVTMIHQAAIEYIHEFAGAPVMNVPQG